MAPQQPAVHIGGVETQNGAIWTSFNSFLIFFIIFAAFVASPGQPLGPAWAPLGLEFPSPVDCSATLPRRGVFSHQKMHFLAPLGPFGAGISKPC